MKRAGAARPQAVLFACGLNAVRSPMAAAVLKQMLGGSLYVGSAGVRRGELDPFAGAVMEEIGIDINDHRPITFDELEDLEGLKSISSLPFPRKRITRRSSSRACWLSRSNIGRPPTRGWSRAAASSVWKPIARFGISLCRTSASGSSPA